MKVGIVGTGLIGGSLAYALKRSGLYEIYCFNRNTDVSKNAKEAGAVDNYFLTSQELTEKSDIIILATTLSSYREISLNIAEHLKDKIFTDIGSVKFKPSIEIFEIVGNDLKKNFVPAHPIAGKETSGFESASADLFIGKKLIITPFDETKKIYVNEVSKMWAVAGSIVEIISSTLHDEIYSSVSHFIQLLSFASKSLIHPSELTKEFCRLQNSPQAMWDEIFLYNKENLQKNFLDFEKNFEKLKLSKHTVTDDSSLINSNDLSAYIISSLILKSTKEEYKNYAGTGFKSFTEIAVKFNGLKATSKVVEETFITIEKIINEIKNSYLPGHI